MGSYQKICAYGASSVSGVAMPALQSEIVPAMAMWGMNTDASLQATDGGDRSGNGRNLGFSNAYLSIPDIIPGHTAPMCWTQDALTPFVFPQGALESNPGDFGGALAVVGEISITFRAQKSLLPPLGDWANYEYMLAYGNRGDATESGNVVYSILLNRDNPNDGRLTYFCQNGPGKTAVIFVSTLTLGNPVLPGHSDGFWHFVSLRRNAAGTIVTLGIDGNFETSGVLLPPTITGNNGRLAIGKPSGGLAALPDIGFIGALKDVCIWPVSLSDAQILTLRQQSLGPYFV